MVDAVEELERGREAYASQAWNDAWIAVPTSLIWGRHDLATPLAAAEAASARYGWSLHVIEACADDPPVEQPEAFTQALGAAVGRARRSA